MRKDAFIADLMDRLPLYGLVPFHVRKESVGFIFNRIWAAVKRESLEIVKEGVSTPAEVDRIFQVLLGAHGGPFRLMDKVGLASISTRNNLVTRMACWARAQANWMISFLWPNQGIGVD